jgi:hypothetical protein
MNDLGPAARGAAVVVYVLGIVGILLLAYILLRPLAKRLFRQNVWFVWVMLGLFTVYVIHWALSAATSTSDY